MDLKTFQDEMKNAMKAQDSVKLGTLRMLISEIKKKEIDKRTTLTPEEIQKTISSMIKQRNDSVEAFEKGGRADLADKEKSEINILKAYLPQQLSKPEVEAIVKEVLSGLGSLGPNDIGKAMKPVLTKIAGRADGKLVNEVVRGLLSNPSN